MKSKRKISRKVKKSQRKVRRTPQAGENERLARSGASPGNYIALQHQYGNQAVQRLLGINQGTNQIQRPPTPLGAHPAMTPLGAHAAMTGNKERERLLQQLLNGAKNIQDYIGGSCYDAAAYIQYLRGLLTFDDPSPIGIGLLPKLNLGAGTLWTGGAIPAGKAVGFKRTSGIGLEGSGGFFHVGVGVGGTNIRAVNGGLLGAGWTDVVNLAQNDLLVPQETEGTYLYDRQQIQVWYR